MTTITCCYPKRYPGPSGVILRHTCKHKKGQPYDGERRTTERLGRIHEAETAATGLDVHPAGKGSSAPVHADCTWHTRLGIEYTTSGICEGPACAAYRDVHSDDATGVR